MYDLAVVLFQLVCLSVASQLENLKEKFEIEDIVDPQFEYPNGSLHLFGDFDALTFLRYEGQQNFTGTINDETDSHGINYYSNDSFIRLIDGSGGSRIDKIVPFGTDSFVLSGSGQLSGLELDQQLLYNLSDLSLRPIFDNSLASVNFILEDYPLVYFGGNFTYESGSLTGHSVVTWNGSSNTTSLLPFVGLGQNSVVNSIVKLDSDNILFAGEFFTLDDESLLASNVSQRNSSRDVEVNQVIPLQLAEWSASLETTLDSSTLVCPNPEKESWSSPSTAGFLEFELPYEVFPNKLRLFNSPTTENAISMFRIISKPSNGIMNLTYVEPLSGELKSCDAFCPLMTRDSLKAAAANSSTTQVVRVDNNLTAIRWSDEYQDFAFVNEIATIDMQILALSSYGTSVGLSSLQLYQSGFTTYANNTLNEIGCASRDDASAASLSGEGWRRGLSGNTYLTAEFGFEQEDLPKVTFTPAIDYSGRYTVNVYTPGCQADETCSSRSIVNVTMWSELGGSILSSVLLYQNNEATKYDQLYSGHLEKAPVVTLEPQSSIYPNNPSNIIVADRLQVIVDSVDILNNSSNSSFPLNGILQYQLSNFTGSSNNTTPIANTELNTYAVQNFPTNASLYSSLFNRTLLVGGSVQGVATIELKENLGVSSTARLATGGIVKGMSTYSDGIILLGDFNLSSQSVSTLTYNGAFGSFGSLNGSVNTVSNISIGDSELLVFDNEYAFNLSSNSYISNNSAFEISLWSAGRNSFNDVLFSGAVSNNQFIDLDGSALIFDNSTAVRYFLGNDIQPYAASYLNDTLSLYAYRNGSTSQLQFNNGIEGPWTWYETINAIQYSANNTLLAISTSGTSIEPTLTLLNLTTFEIVANITLNNNDRITSLVFFDKNSTILVGGEYEVSDANCEGLCLYNYKQEQWTEFANGTIKGNITEIQLSTDYGLLVSGDLNVGNNTSVNLASLNISNYKASPLFWESDKPLTSFIVRGTDILTWNDTNLIIYGDGSWNALEMDGSSLSSILDVTVLKTTFQAGKRSNLPSAFDSVLVVGQNYAGEMQASLHDSERWSSYYVVDNFNNGVSSKASFFTNEDQSQLYDSVNILPYPSQSSVVSPSSTSSSSQPSPTKNSSARKSDRMDRGFVVLVGLALAFGTVVIIGITGVLLSLLFSGDGEYEQVDPRADESEMIDTVPPEKLLKFL